ncbi:hypothetical protein PUN28_009608 [Cardiocondyla obscurior]|uniref:Uncharacterized protein n=1 Tax=Cardiocondyla obscurior TaxID=286306 RepID=A0AAW2FV91_9HYME
MESTVSSLACDPPPPFGSQEYRNFARRSCECVPGDPRRSRSRMDTRPARCHVDVGERRRRCRRGVPFSFYRIGDETTLLPFSRGDTSVRPISLLFLRRSGLLASRFNFSSLPPVTSLPLRLSLSLSTSFTLSPGALPISF